MVTKENPYVCVMNETLNNYNLEGNRTLKNKILNFARLPVPSQGY